MIGYWTFFFVFLSLAEAKQTKHKVDKTTTAWTFYEGWIDASGKKQKASFSMPASLIKEDLGEALRFPKKKSAEFVAKRIRQWGKSQKKFKVSAKVVKGNVRYRISGPLFSIGKAKRELKKVQKKAYSDFLDQHGYTFFKLPLQFRDRVIPDHIKHIKDYAVHLQPMVIALGGPTQNPRVFASKALSYVQSIPYEKRALKKDLYRRPISIIGRNRGDCDSKTVLFLALMRAAYPDMGVGVVYIKGHAFGALELEPMAGETDFREYGKRWVAIEPVGPSIKKVGKIGLKSWWKLFWGCFRLRTIDNP